MLFVTTYVFQDMFFQYLYIIVRHVITRPSLYRMSCGTSQYALSGNGILVRPDALLTSAVNVLTPPGEGIWIGGYSLVRPWK